jgi:hypothetical protein
MNPLQLVKDLLPGKANISTAEFGTLIGIKPTSVRPMISRGDLRIPTFKNGRLVRIKIEDAAIFLEKFRNGEK